jgi:hypothetical protein
MLLSGGITPLKDAEKLSSCFEGAGFEGARLYSLLKNSSFVSGYRFSDTASPSKSDTPLGAGHRN